MYKTTFSYIFFNFEKNQINMRMAIHDLSLIFENTVRLLKRDRTFQIFSCCCILLVGFIQWQAQIIPYGNFTVEENSSTSEMAHLNATLFGVFATLIIMVIGGEIYRKRGQKNTREAIYCRPTANTTLVWGQALGLIAATMLPGIIAMMEGILMNIFSKHAPFHFGNYLFCWFSLIIPLAVFAIGCSFLITGLVRNRILSLVLCSGILGYLAFYMGFDQYGLWDVAGKSLPNTFSDITGHSGIRQYMLQRFGWLTLGLGMIQLSIAPWERLPNIPAPRRKVLPGIIFILTGAILLGIFRYHEDDFFKRRSTYQKTLKKYTGEISPEIAAHEINYAQNGETIHAKSKLLAVNRSGVKLDRIVLYLNPGLKVSNLSAESPIPFTADGQILIIEHCLPAGDTIELHAEYSGKIDEAVGYLDISDYILKDTRERHSLKCRPGRRFAFVSKDFTWLLPEMMWYPMAVPPVNSISPWNSKKDFTRYTLRVKNPGIQKIISQGKHFKQGEDHIFRNEEAITGISLCMGNYQSFGQVVDSVNYSFSCPREQGEKMKRYKKSRTEWQEIIRDQRQRTDHMMGRPYPYKRLMIVEIPRSCTSYYREWKTGSEFVQPEIVFVREKAFSPDKSKNTLFPIELGSLITASSITPLKNWETLLSFNQTWHKPDPGKILPGNPYYISPIYHEQHIYLHSNNFPILNHILSTITNEFNATRPSIIPFSIHELVNSNNSMEKYSLKEMITTPELTPEITQAVCRRKAKDLVFRLETIGIKTKDLVNFIFRFKETHQYCHTSYTDFKNDFTREFHVNPDSLLNEWYTSKGLAKFWVKDCKNEPLLHDDKYTSIYTECSVFNAGESDGLICLRAVHRLPKNQGSVNTNFKRHQKAGIDIFHVYRIKAGTGKRITLLADNCDRVILDMNLSHNLPEAYTLKNDVYGEILQYSTDSITREDFLERETTIADNSDMGFRIIRPIPLLEKWFKKDNEETIISNFFPSTSWQTIIEGDCYGLIEKSYAYRLAGKGNTRCKWEVELKEEGIYEIFVHTKSFTLGTPLTLEYTVHYEDKEEITRITPTSLQWKWISIGKYPCRAGKNEIYLSDKGEKTQIIAADAVKWVKK